MEGVRDVMKGVPGPKTVDVTLIRVTGRALMNDLSVQDAYDQMYYLFPIGLNYLKFDTCNKVN